MKLLQLYRRVFAALYKPTVRRWEGDEYMASWLTAFGLGGAVCMNLVLAVGILVASTGPIALWFGQVAAIAVVAFILILHYAAFVWRDRYRSVVREFESRPAPERRWVGVVAWTYVVASYLLPAILATIMYARQSQNPT